MSRITHTVTDGGSNFVKAFKMFSGEDDESISDSGGSDIDSDNEEEFSCDGIDTAQIDLTAEDEMELDIFLPPQMRCAAHQLNLICTSDLEKYLKEKRGESVYINVF